MILTPVLPAELAGAVEHLPGTLALAFWLVALGLRQRYYHLQPRGAFVAEVRRA